MKLNDKQITLSIIFITAFLCFALYLSRHFEWVPAESSTFIVLQKIRTFLHSQNDDFSYEVKNSSFIHLFQQLVTSSEYDDKRKREFLQTIQSNINHYSVRHVYILEETWKEMGVYQKYLNDSLSKVVLLPFGRQPTYTDIFNTVSHYIVPRMQKEDMWMVANADIVLGEGFELLLDFMGPMEIIALSRHNKSCQENNQCLNFWGSFDSFLGFGAVNTSITERMDIKQNSFGSENLVLRELQKGGYYLRNPCKSIITYHSPCSGDKPWNKGEIDWVNVNGQDARPPPTHWAFP